MKYNDYAIERLQNRLLELFMKKSTPQKYSVVMFEAVEVIRQLKEQVAPPPNDPLTLEELEGMIGEPLYVIPAEKDPDWDPCWVICMEDYILVHSTTNESRGYLLRRNEDYGKTWLAYRRKPEEGTK